VHHVDPERRRDPDQAADQAAGYPDLTAAAYLTYLGHLRGGVDHHHVRTLADRLGLDMSLRIGAMSHGTRQKVGIAQAFMHCPQVLILDEPTAGLDPLVQREFLALVRDARRDGRTVFLSSHNLYEVEAVADMVAILRRGRLAAVESVEKLKDQAVRRMDLTFDADPPIAALHRVPGVREVTLTGHTVHLVVEGQTAELFRVAAPYGIEQVVTHEPDLEDIFLTYYERQE
jgi:ABC-2 type transport system ATP-binding protein